MLCQVAHAAVRTKDSHLQIVFKKLVGRLGYNKAVWAVAHKLCRVVWKILHQGVSYQERGHRPSATAVKQRANRLTAELRRLGYTVQLTPTQVPA